MNRPNLADPLVGKTRKAQLCWRELFPARTGPVHFEDYRLSKVAQRLTELSLGQAVHCAVSVDLAKLTAHTHSSHHSFG